MAEFMEGRQDIKRDKLKEQEVRAMIEGREPIILTVHRERGNNRDKEVVTRGGHHVSTQGMAEEQLHRKHGLIVMGP